MTYTVTLMDKLEQIKAANAGNDAITDDIAGQAYIEQFGLETFQRADNAVRATKTSRQTADTFNAAATFLDLVHIWGPPEAEIASKIKYAKFHALRILKAIKAGEDPNLSNPTPEPSPTGEEAPQDVPRDEALSGHEGNLGPRQASVEDAPDEQDRYERHLAPTSSLDDSLHPSRASSVPRPPPQQPQTPRDAVPIDSPIENDYYHNNTAGDDVSPLEPYPIDRTNSEGGGYFPSVPGMSSDHNAPNLPAAPADEPGFSSAVDLPDVSSLPPASDQRDMAPSNSFQPVLPSQPSAPPSFQHNPYAQQPPSVPAQAPSAAPQGYYAQPTILQPQPHPMPYQPPPGQMARQENFVVDEERILAAQKHARWAISALNFEDVTTAVKELRGALESLGAR
ncbi:MAG: hypothetical protein M1827_005491 [Pycnora praestabilis]|nr:MAG: hypothetical protein M1827_005491 [Pycnora praestabilis]